ncbi:MAG: hypothetical protein LCH67_06290 [Bacteroidetes bacterium]|jgi:hypothetical protein|nr:hypothetical protein [Bacteroidota bacterium]
MHDIEPFYSWQRYYLPYEDPKSPFFQLEETTEYHNTVYGYYLHPYWDEIGSETLYCKLIMVNYLQKYAVIELIGEWNDTLHNDVMYLKRFLIDKLLKNGIKYFLLLGDNLLQFHGGEDDYYEEWFEDVEDGWIAAINFRDFILEEFSKFRLDFYFNYGGTLQIQNWRTLKPDQLFSLVNSLIVRRLS